MALRKLGWLVGIACLLALAFLTFPASPAGACSCVGPMSADDYLDQSDAAFYGDVIAARIADPESVVQGNLRIGSPTMVYTFDVQEVYKGSVRERQEVRSSLDGASCGAELHMNHRYVVYARGAPLYTGLCHGTHEPDGVTPFPRIAAGAPLADGEDHLPFKDGGKLLHADEPSIGLAAFAGLMLLSGAIAGALIALAGRT